MSETVIQVENVSKLYRLGEVGTGSLAHDVNRWWHRVRGKEDPYRKVGETNEREQKGDSDYAWALRGVSFEVKRGEVLGIIGRNGAGKSTLLKILSRITSQTEGRIKIKGRIASLLEVGTGFHPELTGRENIFLNGAILGMRKAEIARKFEEIVEFSGCARYIDTPVKRYSSGMSVRLAFAVAAHLEPEILIVDEVLAVGDAEFQKKCLGKMKEVSKREGRTILFVSHNMRAVQDICSHGMVLSRGSIQVQGTVESAIHHYMGTAQQNNQVEFQPSPDRPKIRFIKINSEELKHGNLIVDIGFESPFELSPAVLGVVVTSAMGTPVFGSNPRFHKQGYEPTKLSKGVARLTVKDVPLCAGTYSLSAWLGDWHQDYDEKRDIISFQFKGGWSDVKRPNPESIGFIETAARWSNV